MKESFEKAMKVKIELMLNVDEQQYNKKMALKNEV